MIPVYLETIYRYREGYEDIKTIFTIHNIQYQGIFGKNILYDLMGISDYHMGILEYDGSINLMKGAFETADYITTVSPTYAKEILDPWFAYGLDRMLCQKQDKLIGILNGIDVENYDPKTDKNIPYNYTARALSNKKKCKAELQKEMGLEVSDRPLVGIVTRFVAHKGVGMVRYVFEELVSKGIDFVVLGSGEQTYEEFFREMGERYPGKVSVNLGFKPDLARKIYAGADIFLMPSENEPCGLAQMIALRYGTIPVIRETGGLKDTVFDDGEDTGNGFTFKTCNAHDMMNSLLRATEKYKDDKKWKALIRRAMKCDNSWTSSAQEYVKLYEKVIGIEK
jgi:starch synthase